MNERARPSRTAALLLAAVLALLVAAGVSDAVGGPRDVAVAPVTQPPAASGTWYCPVTTSPEEGAVLSVAAVGDAVSEVTVVRYGDGGPAEDPLVGIAPGDQLDVELPPGHASFPLAVRWRGGPAVTTWRTAGNATAAGPCEPAPSRTWYVTGFETTDGTTSLLHLFNPFTEDAVVRVVFGTPDGPQALVRTDNVLVPAARAVTLNVGEFQPEVPDVATAVEVVAGRVIAQGEVQFNPRASGPRGRALLPAAPEPALAALFAYARDEERASTWLSIYNPASHEAAVEVRVSDPRADAAVLLGETSVPAGGVARIDLSETSAAPEFGVNVSVVNDTPVVVTRLTAVRTETGRQGVAASRAAVEATVDAALVGGGAGRRSGRVSLYNPGPVAATAQVLTAQGAPEAWAAIELAPNGRLTIDLPEAGEDREAIPIRIRSDQPIVSELRSISFGGGLQLWTLVALPSGTWTGPRTRPVVRRDGAIATRPLGPITAPTPEVTPLPPGGGDVPAQEPTAADDAATGAAAPAGD